LAPDATYRHAFSTTYDDLGQLATRTYPTGRVVEWERNAKGFLTGIRTAEGIYATGLSWDPAGRLASWVAGNGVSWNAAFESETGLLESIRVTGATGSTIEHRRYGFDPADRIEQIQDLVRSGADQAFDYDPGGRLEWAEGPYGEAGAATTLRYGFDTVSNMTCLAGTSLPDCSGGTTATFPPLGAFGAPHQPSEIGGAAAAHDALGNLRALGGAREYTYTDVGQLETVKQNGVEVARFRYDADSRLASIASQSGPDRLLVTPDFEWDTDNRVGRIVIRLGDAVIAVHEDAYDPEPGNGGCAVAGPALPIDSDPWALLWLFAPGLAATALAWMVLRGRPRLRVDGFRWVRSGGTLVLCIAITTNGFACPGGTTHALSPPSVTYFFQDHLGSTIVVADSAAGTTSSFYRPFGQRVGAGNPPEYGYTGQRFQSDSGLYHYGARWYDPALGRFLQPDAILPSLDEPGNLNPYGYVLYDPVNRVDPTGMFQMDAMPDPDPFFGFPGTVIPDDQLDGIYAGSTFMISNGETLGFPPAGEPVFGWPFQNSIVPAGNLTLEWVGRTIAFQSGFGQDFQLASTGAEANKGFNVNLLEHEAAGGHTLKLHVGKTLSFLRHRIDKEHIPAGSTFRSIRDAAGIVNAILNENAAQVNALRRLPPDAAAQLTLTSEFSRSTGYSVTAGQRGYQDVFSATVIVRYPAVTREGFLVFTSFPHAP